MALSAIWPDIVWPGLAVVFCACAASMALIVLLRPLLVRYALARPNARSSHVEPTPQGGGVAVVVATLTVSALAFVWLAGAAPRGTAELLAVFAATLLLAACGAVDDMRALGVLPRLALHTLAAVLVVAAVPADVRIFEWLPTFAERTALVLTGVWFINLVNFMDGIDWMTVAEFVPLTLGLAVLLAWDGLMPTGVLVALALLGAILGFAPFNRPVARLFLGDVGSLPLGLLAGWLLIHLAAAGHLAAALLLPLYYLADATVTLLRRIGNGEEIWQAHRTHFYQRATANGFTVMQVVGGVFVVNLGLALLAFGTVVVPGPVFDVVAFFAGCILVGALLVAFVRNEKPLAATPRQPKEL